MNQPLVFVPRHLLSSEALAAHDRLQEVLRRLKTLGTQASRLRIRLGRHESRLAQLERDLSAASDATRSAAQRALSEYGEWFRPWKAERDAELRPLEREIADLEAERDRLERFLSDFVALKTG